MQHATERVERPGESQEALNGKKSLPTVASVEKPDEKKAGLGGVLVDSAGDCTAWFGLHLDRDACNLWGADMKDTIVYELELLAACVALELWAPYQSIVLIPSSLWRQRQSQVCIDPWCCSGRCCGEHHAIPSGGCSNIWFARVPTEANIADLPSRALDHSFLASHTNVNSDATTCLGLRKVFGQSSECTAQLKEKWGW